MSNARIEEVDSDDASDPEEQDLDAFDFARPQGVLGQQPSSSSSAPQMSPDQMQALLAQQQQQQNARQQGSGMSDKERERLQREQQQKSKNYQCIYPVYFDASRSREEGRRVKKENAVNNPLAREIVTALQDIGEKQNIPLQIVFEPSKCHPKDWANPGRVRVLVKQDGKPVSAKMHNKHHLYTMIASHLKANPTTQESPLNLRLQGLPPPKDGKAPEPAIPRGFKMGSILPLHSPALSGGGVSDNFFKDMMSEMGGQLPPGMEGMANMANMGAGGGGGGKPKMQKIRVGKGK